MRKFPRRSRKLAPVAVIVILALGFVTVLLSTQVNAQGGPTVTGVGPWTQQGNYGSSSTTPGVGGIGTLGASCVVYNGYAYCIGGQNPQGMDLSDVFYAQFTAGGMGAWTETIDYGATSGTSGSGGTVIEWPSCVESGGYVYCVAGASTGGTQLSKVYYAQLSTSGVGPWTETRDYASNSTSDGTGGIKGFQLSCVADSGYIYCVGGGAGASSKVFYAQLSPSGVGPWMETTDYGAATGNAGSGGVPIGSTACVDNAGYVYCIGGMTTGFAVVSDVFSASVSSSGVGAWTEDEDYGSNSTSNGTGGVPIWGTACVVYFSYIICVGGTTSGHALTAKVFFAQDQGIIGWFETGNGPFPTYWDDCVGDNGIFGYLICLGQSSPDVFSGQIDTTSTTTSTSTTPTTSTTETSTTSTTTTTTVKNTPILYTSLNPGFTVPAGTSVYDSAGFVGGSIVTPAGGNVTYYRYSGPNCTGTQTELGTVFVNSNGSVPNSPYTTFPNPGTYYYSASYTGDAHNNPTASACEMLTVIPPSTTSSSSTITTSTTSTSNNDLLYIGIGIGILLLGIGAYIWNRRGKTEPPPPTKEKPPPPPPPPSPPPPPVLTTPTEEKPISCCGPDVTDNVLRCMIKLLRDFFSWDDGRKSYQLELLTMMVPQAVADYRNKPGGERTTVGWFQAINAWDIYELTSETIGGRFDSTFARFREQCMRPDPPCYPSVVFLGHCHRPGVVNYVMWGVMTRLDEWFSYQKKGSRYAVTYDESTLSYAHGARSSPWNPVTGDPNYQDQVAMASVGWQLASGFISGTGYGARPNDYGVSNVDKEALGAILVAKQNKFRETAACLKRCPGDQWLQKQEFEYKWEPKSIDEK